MRILLYAGKGGVGKTSVAAATGAVMADQDVKTLVMSLDPAHSLSDVFDLDVSLMDKHRGLPIAVADGLDIQEIDVYEEIGRNWNEVHRYLSVLLNTAGLDDILAEEMAVLPGMEELSALLYINQYQQSGEYDLVILDCAPTAESLRFVSLPKTLEWYMTKIFGLERRIAKLIRPVAKRLTDVPLPGDDYFAAIARLYDKLRGVDAILTDREMTSLRLVTNPEKMVLKETQRAFMFFCVHQLAVDAIIINRMSNTLDQDLRSAKQQEYLELADTFFKPLPILKAPFREVEILGHERLLAFGKQLYQDIDPIGILYRRHSYVFERVNDINRVSIHLPFVIKEEINLTKIGDELIVKVGNIRKSVILPPTLAHLKPMNAKMESDTLVVEFGGENGKG